MPTQEQNALIRYETLKAIIKTYKSVSGDQLFAEMFDKFGILERTTSRYLKYLKLLGFIDTERDLVIWKGKNDE
jgi:hypothetical protein